MFKKKEKKFLKQSPPQITLLKKSDYLRIFNNLKYLNVSGNHETLQEHVPK